MGPDLTAVGRRFNQQNLLEALVDPSKVVSDQYQATLFSLTDGRQVAGRVINLNAGNYLVLENMMNPGALTPIEVEQIDEMAPSPVSMMPQGLLDSFTEDEIRDMVAFLRTGAADAVDAGEVKKKAD